MSNNQDKLNEQLFNVIKNDEEGCEARLKKVKYLVYLGANVNAKLYGKSMLSLAIDKKAGFEVVKFLIEKGADEWIISKEDAEKLSNAFWDEIGYFKSIDEIKQLLKKGADIDAKDNFGKTALMWAARDDDMIELVKCLVDNGANINAKDNKGTTALDLAKKFKADMCVKFLSECKEKEEAKKAEVFSEYKNNDEKSTSYKGIRYIARPLQNI